MCPLRAALGRAAGTFWGCPGGRQSRARCFSDKYSPVVAPRYDESKWPLYRVYLPETALSHPEFLELLDTLDGLYLRAQHFGVLLDARAAPPLSAKERGLAAERGNNAEARYPGLLVGFAVVLSSPLQRGVFTAIHWLLKRSQTTRAFASTAAAEAWLSSRLGGGA